MRFAIAPLGLDIRSQADREHDHVRASDRVHHGALVVAGAHVGLSAAVGRAGARNAAAGRAGAARRAQLLVVERAAVEVVKAVEAGLLLVGAAGRRDDGLSADILHTRRGGDGLGSVQVRRVLSEVAALSKEASKEVSNEASKEASKERRTWQSENGPTTATVRGFELNGSVLASFFSSTNDSSAVRSDSARCALLLICSSPIRRYGCSETGSNSPVRIRTYMRRLTERSMYSCGMSPCFKASGRPEKTVDLASFASSRSSPPATAYAAASASVLAYR